MEFTDKYTTIEVAEKGKTQISNEAYAVSEMIDKLISKLESLRCLLK